MSDRSLQNEKRRKCTENTLIMFYKQRFISNDFLTSLFLKKNKQRSSLFSKN